MSAPRDGFRWYGRCEGCDLTVRVYPRKTLGLTFVEGHIVAHDKPFAGHCPGSLKPPIPGTAYAKRVKTPEVHA